MSIQNSSTGSTQTELNLLATNSALQAQVDAISRSQAVIYFRPDGTILDANPNFLSVMGYSLDEVQGKNHSMFVESAYAGSLDYQKFWENLRSGDFLTSRFKRLGKHGKEVWIEGSYNPLLDANGQVEKVMKVVADVTGQAQAQEEITTIVGLATRGILDKRINGDKFHGAEAKFVSGVNALLDAIAVPMQEMNQAMQALSLGDLTKRMAGEFQGEFEKLGSAVNSSIGDLEYIVTNIRDASASITAASGDISQGNYDLSRRTEQQAASLEETAASMEQLAGTMKQNAANAELANTLSNDAKTRAQTGGTVVTNAIEAMQDINSASRKISDIIGVIDEIAFQTNLLALNAAVEAARAGEQGRGFAVVATEVRNLAQRSASAAKEIKVLIKDSVTKVEEGSELVNQSGEVLNQIVESVVKVSVVIGEITAAVQEQSSGIDQVNMAISNMDSVTQQNAALVEEAAAASEAMNQKAVEMQGMMEHFITRDCAVEAAPVRQLRAV
jgi:methyl-accepting chemotaxis protein